MIFCHGCPDENQPGTMPDPRGFPGKLCDTCAAEAALDVSTGHAELGPDATPAARAKAAEVAADWEREKARRGIERGADRPERAEPAEVRQVTPPRKWSDDARELVRRLGPGQLGLDAGTLEQLESGHRFASELERRTAGRRVARFPITWSFDGTHAATVEINRSAGTISVRPYRRRRAYTLPLAFVAEVIATRVIKAEAISKRKAGRSPLRRRRSRR